MFGGGGGGGGVFGVPKIGSTHLFYNLLKKEEKGGRT